MTGTGYYLHFLSNGNTSEVGDINNELSESFLTTLPPPQNLVGFTLVIRRGRLDWLEGYTFGDVRWPEEPMEGWLIVDKALAGY